MGIHSAIHHSLWLCILVLLNRTLRDEQDITPAPRGDLGHSLSTWLGHKLVTMTPEVIDMNPLHWESEDAQQQNSAAGQDQHRTMINSPASVRFFTSEHGICAQGRLATAILNSPFNLRHWGNGDALISLACVWNGFWRPKSQDVPDECPYEFPCDLRIK